MTDTGHSQDDGAAAAGKKRPPPGQRRVQILQMLASMLERPQGERITTAALAAKLEVSEAALYRHFASKAQMFEGLIEFIEQSVFSLINQIVQQEPLRSDASTQVGVRQVALIVDMLLRFAQKNPGMARVMVGDALVFEDERLQQRMTQLFDKIEATLRQVLRDDLAGDDAPSATAALRAPAPVCAAVAVAFVVGRLQQYVRSGFKRSPTDRLDECLSLLLG